jgi:hypothetical protein
MVEIGFAAALKKPVFLGIGPNLIGGKELADLWMLREAATRVAFGNAYQTWVELRGTVMKFRTAA